MQTQQLLAIVWEKSKFNLKSEAAVNYLSYTWWVIEPVIQMACYYLVFDLLLNRGGPGFVYFLLTGLVPWLWFTRTITQGSNSLVSGKMLMGQIFIPKLFFPLVIVTQCGIKQVIVFLALFALLALSSFSPSIHWASLLALIFTQLSLMIPIACLLAVAVIFIRDLKFIIPTLLQFVFFCSGIFFSVDAISTEYKDIFFINPIAGLIHQYREVLLNEKWPDWIYLAKIIFASVCLWAITIYIYLKHEYTITKAAQE